MDEKLLHKVGIYSIYMCLCVGYGIREPYLIAQYHGGHFYQVKLCVKVICSRKVWQVQAAVQWGFCQTIDHGKVRGGEDGLSNPKDIQVLITEGHCGSALHVQPSRLSAHALTASCTVSSPLSLWVVLCFPKSTLN